MLTILGALSIKPTPLGRIFSGLAGRSLISHCMSWLILPF
jgi:hypothetical protein